jgi:cyclase
LAPSIVSGQETEAWRSRFAAGEEARQSGDLAAYATEMAAAAGAMPEDHLNRPFVQYHAARAAALVGKGDEAVQWLRRAWDEGIESLMISFAAFDPAFADIVDTQSFRDVMNLAADMELSVRSLGGNVHLIGGAGANVVAQIGSDGVFLVDTGYGPALPALRAALASLGHSRVARLLVTHAHEDHMGATPELGDQATVLAHPAAEAEMLEPYVFIDGVTMPPKPTSALPDVRIAADTTIRFNGEDVRIVATEAHTAGDLSLYFAGSRVAHLGDTYLSGNPMMYPGREDPEGFLNRLEAFLDAMDPTTVVVGGHGDPVGLDAVRGQIAASRACMALVRESLADDLSLEETAERGADRFPPQWVAFFYGLFTQGG